MGSNVEMSAEDYDQVLKDRLLQRMWLEYETSQRRTIMADDQKFTGSNLPYHNAETEKIAEQRKPDPNQPYAFAANGFKVTEVKSDDAPTTYEVKADSGKYTKTYETKEAAEFFCTSHAPHFVGGPANQEGPNSKTVDEPKQPASIAQV